MGNMFENQTILSTIAVQALDDFSGVDGFDSKQPNFDEPKKISGQPSPKEMAIILCQLQYQNTVHTEGPSCPTIWDDFYCWPATLADHIVSRNCSEIFNQHSLPVDINIMGEARAYRICDQNGDWLWGNWTNYTECLQLLSQDSRDFSSSQVAVTYILFVCSLVSLVALFLTLFIFCYFKSLQCSRLRVHRNLVVALIIHSVLLVIISSPGVLQARYLSYVDINWLCKTILSLKMYAAMASINWMFVEGLLLHSRITISVFNKDAPFKLYYMIGWDQHRIFGQHRTNTGYQAANERLYRNNSSEGIFVAVLYCFLNSEVQTVLRNAYLRAILQRDPNHHLTRRRGLSRTSASYLSNCDTSVSDSARHKVAPSVNVMVPLHEMSQQEEHRGRKQLKFLKTNSERQRIFSI
ncbi:PDF receptor-like isoform X3 [Tachypleus tridentatus]|uniref:PDF receptor-like isoform X3 n=1 Tax=Tachypleus tridentatus TaxID=6853 RepID=UPI003FD0143B